MINYLPKFLTILFLIPYSSFLISLSPLLPYLRSRMLLPSSVTVTLKQRYSGHTAGVFALAEGLDEATFLSGGGDGVIAQWKMDGSADATGIARVPGNIFSLLPLPDRHLILAGDLHGGLHSIDTRTRTEVNRFAWDGGAVYAIERLSDAHVAVCSGTGNLVIRNVQTHTTEQVIAVSSQSLRGISTDKTRRRLAIASSDYTVHILNADTFKTDHILKQHTNSVFCVRWSPDGKWLLSGSRDAQLMIWDAETLQLEQQIPAHMFTINDIQFSPDGRLFATAGRDKHIKIWDAETFTLLKVLDVEKYDGHRNSVNKLFWSTSTNTLISCGDDRMVMRWEIS